MMNHDSGQTAPEPDRFSLVRALPYEGLTDEKEIPMMIDTPALQFLNELLSLTPQPVFLVGGPVRDLLLGKQDIKDIDLLMPSGSESVARQFADRIGGSFFFLDEERK
ncbi:MAG TPA: hypothetical protein VF903_08360, partial [Nitrospirota bacterium]